MSATYTVNAGLGIPSLKDGDFPTTIAATFAQVDAEEAIGQFGSRPREIPSTSLVFVVAAGTVVNSDNTESVYAGGSVTLPANQTNYVFLNSSLSLTSNTTGFPASTTQFPVAKVVTGASTITNWTPARRAWRMSGASLGLSYLSLAGGTLTGLPVLSGTGNSSGFQLTATAAPSAPSDGQVWYDSTAKCFLGSIAGSTARFPGVQFIATASATVANTTTPSTLVPTGVGSATLAANQLVAGKTVRMKAAGYLSTTGTPTIAIAMGLGGASLSSGAVTAGSSITNLDFRFEADFTCRSTGAGGTFFAQGKLELGGVGWPLVATSTVTADTTSALAATLAATWGTAASGNTVTVTNLTVEILN